MPPAATKRPRARIRPVSYTYTKPPRDDKFNRRGCNRIVVKQLHLEKKPELVYDTFKRNGPFSFHDLPLEIQGEIYKYLVAPVKRIFPHVDTLPLICTLYPEEKRHLSIMRASKAHHAAAAAMFYSYPTFVFQRFQPSDSCSLAADMQFSEFMSELVAPPYRPLVRSVVVSHLAPVYVPSNLDQFVGLRDLTVGLTEEFYEGWKSRRGCLQMEALKGMVALMRIRKQLRTLVIEDCTDHVKPRGKEELRLDSHWQLEEELREEMVEPNLQTSE